LEREVQSHLELAADDLQPYGPSREEAMRLARLQYGSVSQAVEEMRDQRGLRWLEDLGRDLGYGFRALRRSPAFTIVAILTLASGIGVNTAVFTVSNAVLFKGFRLVDRNDRILYIHSEKNGQYSGVSYPDFQDWRSQAGSFAGIGAVADLRFTLNDQSGLPERCTATRITVNGFHLLGRQPIMGRDFAPSDELPGAQPVAILSYEFWERRFAKDPGVIGRTLKINSAPPMTVIGIMPEGFSFPQNQDLWMPLALTRELQRRDDRSLWFAFGRLRDGVTEQHARAELETIGKRSAAAWPDTNQGQVPRPHTFAEFFTGPHAAMTYGMIQVAVDFVLLIACANLANLLLARMTVRSREISRRIALGASRWRVIRQILTESLLLSMIGGFLGWWIAWIGVRSYALATNSAAGEWRRDLLDYGMDQHVFAYFAAISIAAGLLFAVVPAFWCTGLDLNTVLKNRGAEGMGAGRNKYFSGFLLMTEVALAVVLVAGMAAMVHSFLNIYTADIGVRIANIRTMLLHLPEARYSVHAKQVAFFDNLKSRLESLPGVESVSLGDPPAGGIPGGRPYQLPGDQTAGSNALPTVVTQTIGSDYVRTLGATLSGREFNSFDGASGVQVAIVNRRFADERWPGQNAIGQRLRLFDKETPEAWRTVVGVVSNIVYDPRRQDITPVVYLPYSQRPDAGEMWVLVRTPLPLSQLARLLRHEISALDPDVLIWLGPYNLADRLASARQYSDIRDHTALLLIFAAVALALALLGLYAVSAHSVTQRTQEIGVRIAVGATALDILMLVSRLTIAPLSIGCIVGLAGAFAGNRILSSELVGVSVADPATFVLACAALTAAAVLGCQIPARRAMRVDPVAALRHE
jgi:predicted permease